MIQDSVGLLALFDFQDQRCELLKGFIQVVQYVQKNGTQQVISNALRHSGELLTDLSNLEAGFKSSNYELVGESLGNALRVISH